MVKNVKIDDETHRQLRITAAELECNIGDLASIALTCALREHTKEELKTIVKSYESNDQRKV